MAKPTHKQRLGTEMTEEAVKLITNAAERRGEIPGLRMTEAMLDVLPTYFAIVYRRAYARGYRRARRG